MTWLLVAQSIGSFGFVVWAVLERGKRADLTIALDDAGDESKDLTAKLKASEDSSGRKSLALARIRREVYELETQLETCTDPVAIRAGLRRMLSKDPDSDQAGAGPVQPAADS